jgi:hypothetical protein
VRRWGVRGLVVVIVAGIGACGAPTPSPTTRPTVVASPGPLVASHASLACSACHRDRSPLVNPAACSSCHAALGDGLHAKPRVREQTCTECHRDHRGASYDARWGFFGGVARFDHALTGWKLAKGHRVACERCHPSVAPSHPRDRDPTGTASSPTFRGATTACASCHAPPHAGTPYAKLACESCHVSADGWTALAFDHSEKTRFDLGSSHRHVACANCHTDALAATRPSRACASCHASRDPHAGRFAAFGCEACHAPSMGFVPGQSPPPWKPNAFDHRKTGWGLVGRHSQTACRTCHRAPGTTLFVPLGRGKDCLGCHEHFQVHARKYSNALCANCHYTPG